MKRRDFLRAAILSLPPSYWGTSFGNAILPKSSAFSQRRTDVLVIGGGLGGCAAALAVARSGRSAVLTEETDWIGGQLTAQAVPPDEHPWIESFGAPSSYRHLRHLIREYYRHHYPLNATALHNRHLNPGDGMVSRLCIEPRVALAALYQMMAPHISAGRIDILLHHRPVAAESDHDVVRSVTCENALDGDRIVLEASYVIDATETGELLPMTRTEYVSGFEAQSDTQEPHAPSEVQPANMQAVTWCFPMEYVPGQDSTVDKPAFYDTWKNYVPRLNPPWPGKLFSWTYTHPMTLSPKTLAFDPDEESTGWWTYRRIVSRHNFVPGSYAGSTTCVNWPQNDYLSGNFCEVTAKELAEHTVAAKQLSLALFYWMQTEAPRPDGGTGWPGLRLRPNLVGTNDGLAKSPYIRESRRLKAQFRVVEQHVSADIRMKESGRSREEVRAASFFDSVGLGSYRIDLHPSTGGDNYVDLSSLPFEIPLGALIPQRVKNLLAGCKNLGVTHITNGCYRLHPVEWNIGESAGALAAHCVETGLQPVEVRNSPKRLAQFQQKLLSQGVEIRWPQSMRR